MARDPTDPLFFSKPQLVVEEANGEDVTPLPALRTGKMSGGVGSAHSQVRSNELGATIGETAAGRRSG